MLWWYSHHPCFVIVSCSCGSGPTRDGSEVPVEDMACLYRATNRAWLYGKLKTPGSVNSMLPQVSNFPVKWDVCRWVFRRKLRLKPGSLLQFRPGLHSPFCTGRSSAGQGRRSGLKGPTGFGGTPGKGLRRAQQAGLSPQGGFGFRGSPCPGVGPAAQRARLLFSRKQGLRRPVLWDNCTKISTI